MCQSKAQKTLSSETQRVTYVMLHVNCLAGAPMFTLVTLVGLLATLAVDVLHIRT